MLPSAMRRYGLIVIFEISLETKAVSNKAQMTKHLSWAVVILITHVDDGNDIGCSIVEFAHVDGEMCQLIPLRFDKDMFRSLSHCVDTPQICCRVNFWVRRGRQGDVWE